jgi:cobalt-zinc-cadmium efflux system outer membrane protein
MRYLSATASPAIDAMTGKPMTAFQDFLAIANPFGKQACAMAAMCLLAAAPLRAQQPTMIQQAALIQPQQPLRPPQPMPETLSAPATIAPAPPGGGEGNPPGGFRTPLTLPNISEPPPGVTVLTLEDLEQIALINNPTIGRAQALVASARGNWVQVGLPPNPSWGYLGQQLGSGRIASQHMAMVDGQLVTGGKLRWNRAIAEQEILRSEQVMFAAQQRVLTDVRVAFYEALIAQRNLDLSQQLLNIAREANNTAQRLFNAGETSEVDYLLAQIEVSNAQNNEAIARQRHFAAWQSLRAVLGVPNMPAAALSGDLESIPDNLTWDDTLGRLLSISPEIGAAVANLERARAALVRARRENIPDIRFQAGPMKDMGFKEGKWDGIVQLLVPLPILNRNQGAIAQAVADISAAERGIQQVELDLQNRLAPVFERYASSTSVVRRYREQILPVAEKSLELVRRGYAAGEFPFLNLLNAQRTYFQTNNLYLQALLDLRTSTSQIEGLLLNNSLGTSF